jgi:hypothetical protein
MAEILKSLAEGIHQLCEPAHTHREVTLSVNEVLIKAGSGSP